MPKDSKELKEKLMKIVNEAVNKDAELRAQLQIGEKFKFIRDRLAALKQHVEAALQTIQLDTDQEQLVVDEDEQLVYVYLFNAHGIDLQTWIKMLHPSVYYEHSVNRPIYGAKEHVESVIRNKANRTQHGYIEVAVKKAMILKKDDAGLKDNIGNPLLKIKEGSLKPDRLISFYHNGHYYRMNEDGKLEKIIIS